MKAGSSPNPFLLGCYGVFITWVLLIKSLATSVDSTFIPFSPSWGQDGGQGVGTESSNP